MATDLPITYRVSGLPSDFFTTGQVTELLSRLFDKPGSRTGLTVHSLGLDAHPFGRNVTRIATVDFVQVPVQLRAGNSWNFSVPSSAQPGAPPIRIQVDSHFLGWTPLNMVKDDAEHEIECVTHERLNSQLLC